MARIQIVMESGRCYAISIIQYFVTWLAGAGSRKTCDYISVGAHDMIDRKNRDVLAQAFRHLAAGVMTNDQFEGAGWDSSSKDPAIREIYMLFAWPLYDDLHKHKMTGSYALTEGMRKDVARCILFLKSDFEYEWPGRTCVRSFLQLKEPWNSCAGDRRIWPFFRRDDYAKARKQRIYIGKRQHL